MTYSFKAPAGSTEVRFREAVRDIRAAGVKWYANRISCCGSCAGGELASYMESKGLDTDTVPVAWTFKGHGYIQWMEDGELAATSYSSYYKKMVKEHAAENLVVEINHDNGAAEIVRDAFLVHGFEVDWNGSDFKCVSLTIPCAGSEKVSDLEFSENFDLDGAISALEGPKKGDDFTPEERTIIDGQGWSAETIIAVENSWDPEEGSRLQHFKNVAHEENAYGYAEETAPEARKCMACGFDITAYEAEATMCAVCDMQAHDDEVFAEDDSYLMPNFVYDYVSGQWMTTF